MYQARDLSVFISLRVLQGDQRGRSEGRGKNKTNDPVVGAQLVWLRSSWTTDHRTLVLGLCFLLLGHMVATNIMVPLQSRSGLSSYHHNNHPI